MVQQNGRTNIYKYSVNHTHKQKNWKNPAEILKIAQNMSKNSFLIKIGSLIAKNGKL